eukprot:TRINITY_DN2294_c1_g2_i1.p2 TRINITY_DN2294_c1_g2~~TRINITY_DN2294_c1_g2_i1.p2  ORF type:complete len:548 (+),score=72.95 TRINITY_DN2294_c1_g2_i1:5144-6787(+)
MISKFRFLVPVLLSGIIAITAQSCFDGDDYDFDKLSDKVNWTPNMIAPVGYGTFSLWYLLNQHEANPADQTIILDADGLLHIKHIEKDIFSYEVDQVLDFPNQAPIDLTFALPDLSAGVPYPLPAIDTQEKEIEINTSPVAITLSELDLSTNIRFLFSNPLDTDVDLTVSLPDGTQAGTPVSQTFRVTAKAVNQEENLNLADLNIKFKQPYTTNNLVALNFDVDVQNNASGIITGSGNINVNLTFQNIDFKLAQGDFGKQNIDIGTGNIDMEVDFWDDIEGDYQFADPRVMVHLRNSVGVPFEINANMTGYNTDGISQALNPDALQPANYPKTVADVLDTPNEETITYDNSNSEIVALMALPPSDRIEYSGSVNLNPAVVDIATTPNIVSNTSRIDADLEIDIPLDLSATNLMLKDTVTDLDIENAEKIMNAAIVVTAENGFPLDAQISKIIMTDDAYKVLDTIEDEQVIEAAKVGADGLVIPSSIKEVSHEIKLTAEQIKHLNDTDNLIIHASVNTTDKGTKAVKLRGDYEIKFKIAVQAQINLNN